MSTTSRPDFNRKDAARKDGARRTPLDPSGGQLPADLDAELGVLGSIMLLPDVCDEVALILRPDDFHDDANRRLFTHMLAMHDRGSKIDPTLLFDELKRSGDLDLVGGAAYLAKVIHSVPNAAHATYYANIVRQKATYRSLIQATTEILRDAYDESLEAKQLLSQAEQKIFAILDSRGGTAVSSIRDILHDAMDRIDARMRGEHTTGGVDTRFADLDQMTGGLHNSELIVLAARPSMGKTAFAMNIAENVAILSQTPVLFVSLEMSAIELADRMLCSVARVNGHRLRNGTISNDDRRRLVQKAGEISQSPLFVDDSPGRTVTEIAAGARRIRRREGRLGMIVIDYLQLIEPDNPKDPRQEQVARITRRLKGLAREMQVPILCLAQLNRQAEDSKEHRPRLSHLRECVPGDTIVQLADGRRVPIATLAGTQPDVVCIDHAQRIVSAKSDAVWHVGRRPVLVIRLASGRSVRATSEHRFLAGSGWTTVGQLKPGDRLAVARQIPEPTEVETWEPARVALLGQLIGDGSYLSGQPMRYTTNSEENSAAVSQAAHVEFGATVTLYAGRHQWHQLLISGNGNRWRPAGVNRWLRDLGIFGQRSFEKRVPESVFQLSNAQIALFLRHLWATDGCIFVRRSGTRGSHSVYYSTTSPHLATDVAALLLRLGIVARTHAVRQRQYRPSYLVSISGGTNQKRFIDIVGAFGPRREAAERLAQILSSQTVNTNVDTLPREVFGQVKSIMRQQGISYRKMAGIRGTSCGGGARFCFAPSRKLLGQYAEILHDDVLAAQAANDLFWDRVISVEPDGEEEVYDLTVPGYENWLADGIVTHNSGAIEQDADVVMFVHREEYYRHGEEQKDYAGQAEIIVAKQRNGPVGTVELVWRKEFTRFEDKAPERYGAFDDHNVGDDAPFI